MRGWFSNWVLVSRSGSAAAGSSGWRLPRRVNRPAAGGARPVPVPRLLIGVVVCVVLFCWFFGVWVGGGLSEDWRRDGSRRRGGSLVSVLWLSPVGGAGALPIRPPLSWPWWRWSSNRSVGRLFRCGVGFSIWVLVSRSGSAVAGSSGWRLPRRVSRSVVGRGSPVPFRFSGGGWLIEAEGVFVLLIGFWRLGWWRFVRGPAPGWQPSAGRSFGFGSVVVAGWRGGRFAYEIAVFAVVRRWLSGGSGGRPLRCAAGFLIGCWFPVPGRRLPVRLGGVFRAGYRSVVGGLRLVPVSPSALGWGGGFRRIVYWPFGGWLPAVLSEVRGERVIVAGARKAVEG